MNFYCASSQSPPPNAPYTLVVSAEQKSFRSCLKPITRVSSQFVCKWDPERRVSDSESPTAECLHLTVKRDKTACVRHRGLSTYGLNGLSQGDEHQAPIFRLHGTFYLYTAPSFSSFRRLLKKSFPSATPSLCALFRGLEVFNTSTTLTLACWTELNGHWYYH